MDVLTGRYTDDALNRRFDRRRLLKHAGALSLSLPVVSTLLAACSGNGDVSSGATFTTATPPDRSPQQRRGGTLRVALTGDPPNLDLNQTTDSIVLLVTSHMYETLFTWDADYRPVPLLAESFEVSEDGLVNTITLRESVPFHNGEIMQAADVIASVQRWGAISSLGQELMGVVEEIVEVDPLTIEFHMRQPYGTFAVALARQLQGCAIYPRSIIEASNDTGLDEFIGTGPYRLVQWNPDQQILLERFDEYSAASGAPDGYAGAKARYLDAIEFVPVPNEASRIAGMQAGDFHYVETVSPDQVPTLVGTEGVTVEVLSADSWLNIVLNMRSPLLDDLRIRRAIQTALDHSTIMLAAFGEGYYELTPELVPGAPIWYSEVGSEYFNVNDPEAARRMLEEAGYDGTPLRIMATQEIQQEYNATLTMKQQLEEVGFVVDFQVFDGATLSSRRHDEDGWDVYTAWASFRPDPVMRNLTCSATGWWCDEEKDQLLADLQTESDYEERFAIWEQVQQRFYEDVPRLKIGNTMRVIVRASTLHEIGPTEMQPEFSNAWLER
jgi:peptide/nickel transport system substrate-binding protein